MKTRFHLPLVALVLAAPAALSAQSVQDFQLPPNPTPTPTSRAQGPVDTESGALPNAPRVIGTPTPTPAPRPSATVEALPSPMPTPVPSPTAAPPPETTVPQPRVTPRAQPSALPTAEERLPLDPGETAPIVPAPVPSETPASVPVAAPSDTVQTEEESGPTGTPQWLWPALGGGLLALLGLGYLVSRRRRTAAPPEIERPVVASASGFAAPNEVQIRAEAIKLTRSVMNATLHYRISLINRSTRALSQVALGADIVTAHGGVPVEEQVASAKQRLEVRHTFERIAPGQSVRHEGQITIPLAQARLIRQGRTALLVPLLRVRLDGASEEPLVQTYVIGQGVPGGGRVTPFPMDDGPRSYEPIAARAID